MLLFMFIYVSRTKNVQIILFVASRNTKDINCKMYLGFKTEKPKKIIFLLLLTMYDVEIVLPIANLVV